LKKSPILIANKYACKTKGINIQVEAIGKRIKQSRDKQVKQWTFSLPATTRSVLQ